MAEGNGKLAQNFDAIQDFDGGVYMQKVNTALTEAAQSAVRIGRQSIVVLEIKFDQIEGLNQVAITHSVTKTIPRMNGATKDVDKKKTPMFVHNNGQMSCFTEEQQEFGFTKPRG